MKDFEFFLKKGDVKKQNPDKNLSSATFKESLDRLELSKNLYRMNKKAKIRLIVISIATNRCSKVNSRAKF